MDNTAKELYIIGAGGFGREVADTVSEINKASSGSVGGVVGDTIADRAGISTLSQPVDPFLNGPVYRVAGFIDDDESLWGKAVNGIDVKGGVEYLRSHVSGGDKPCAVIAIADPRIKEGIAEKLNGCVAWVNIIHPLAFFMNTATLGTGVVVQQFASVNANAKVGDHCLINSHTVVGHDAVLEDCVSIMHSVGAMGFCTLKTRSYIGAGAVMIQNVVIGEDATVGAGAVVIRDVPPWATVVGNPARIIKRT
jgi:acetyltransferase EpsM